MIRARILLGLCAVLAAVVVAPSAASADPFEGPPICSSAGTALSGSYGNLTVTGNAYVAKGTTLNVWGNLTLAKGSCLDAFTLGTVKVGGSVLVGEGATLGLGCSPGAIGPKPPCGTSRTSDTVGGNIIANQPLTMYLTATSIRGSVVSIGGGPGPVFSPYINYPIKENVIGGNLLVAGWKGAWFGVLRNSIGGNAVLLNNVGVTISEETHLPDSSEIVSNSISGNLVCFGNQPAAQIGDSEGAPNNVGGHKYGQCTAL
jgi:hypothetical protein